MAIDLREQPFGLELEFTGITRQAAAKVAGEYFGITPYYAGGGYDEWTVNDTGMRTWKFMSDSSIKAQRKSGGRIIDAGREYAVEFVTPICHYSDIETIQEIVRRLRKAGGLINSSVGIHIHVSGANHTTKSLKNLLNIFYSKQDLLYRALEVDSVRSGYCKKFTESFIKSINAQKEYRMEELKNKWYALLGGGSSSGHYNQSRYHGLNIHSFYYRSTVEFRFLNSTLHAGKVKAYIQLCLAISAQAINQKYAIARVTETDNPCFTFRTWLLKLGMIGDEFKTARLHLLSKLEGNSAWRYEEGDYPSRRRHIDEEGA